MIILGNVLNVELILRDENHDLVPRERIELALKNASVFIINWIPQGIEIDRKNELLNLAAEYYAVCEIIRGIYTEVDSDNSKSKWYCSRSFDNLNLFMTRFYPEYSGSISKKYYINCKKDYKGIKK